MKKLFVLLLVTLSVGFGIFLGNSGVNIESLVRNVSVSQLDVAPSAGEPVQTKPASATEPMPKVTATTEESDKSKDMTVIATLNGVPIYKWEAQTVIADLMASQNLENRPYESLKEEEKLAVTREIATKKILRKNIDESKIAEEKNVRIVLDNIRNNFLQSEYLTRKAKATITPETIKAHYDDAIKQIEGKDELRISNILVEKEADAKKIYQDLLKNPDSFAEIAKTKSKDSSSANGGDTGYALQGSFVKEIEEAANSLKKGEISKPIKTSLGWNIIKLEDKRKTTISPLEKIKDKVEQELIKQNTQKYLLSLLEGQKLELAGQEKVDDTNKSATVPAAAPLKEPK